MYPQVYRNQQLVKGLANYCGRLKGELKRADKDARSRRANLEEINARRTHYAELLSHAEAVLRSLAPGIDLDAIPARVTQLQPYRTTKSELRMEIIRQLKRAPEPMALNELHAKIIQAMGLRFQSQKEKRRHRAVLMDALHALRRSTPPVVEALLPLEFGRFNQPEQRWHLLNLRG